VCSRKVFPPDGVAGKSFATGRGACRLAGMPGCSSNWGRVICRRFSITAAVKNSVEVYRLHASKPPELSKNLE
jgi:hypothetical protein